MKINKVKIESLTSDPANVRLHSEQNLDAIKASLNRFGQQKPIVVNSKNVVIAGNGTLAAAKALGWSDINVVRTELAGTDAVAFAIADNRTAELATWDKSSLAQILQTFDGTDVPLESTGFDQSDLAAMLGDWSVDPRDGPVEDYDADNETFHIRVEGVHASDKQAVLDLLNVALKASGYPYEPKAY